MEHLNTRHGSTGVASGLLLLPTMIQLAKISLRFLIRRSVRYLLVSRGFQVFQAVTILAALSFVLTGSRIAFIDRYGNRADIVASIFVTVATIALLTSLNRRVMTSIDRRFFREAYNAELILTELGEAIPTLSKTEQLVELVAAKISDALHPENVTIFLDDENSGVYVAAFSLDTVSTDGGLPTRLRDLVLHFDDWPIEQLRKSILTLPESINVDDLKVSTARDSQALRAVRSRLLIPISSNGRINGLISLGQRLSDLPYTREDKRLLRVVANQTSAFIENMELLNRMVEDERTARELQMAADVQRHLFPAAGLEDDHLDIYGTCLPALGVGGDYYDYFETDKHRTSIAIADVSGKGLGAALLMSTVQASLRCQLTSSERSLPHVVSSMNRLLQRSTGEGSYATFFLAQFDNATGRLSYVNAGHNPPMLVRNELGQETGAEPFKTEGSRQPLSSITSRMTVGLAVTEAEEPAVRLLTTGGPIIGTFLNGPYKQETITLRRGDIIAIYTDGVTEAVNPAGEEFGAERLQSILIESVRLSASESAKNLIAKVLEWQGLAPQHDDITLIVVKVK